MTLGKRKVAAVILVVLITVFGFAAWYWWGTDALLAVVLAVVIAGIGLVTILIIRAERRLRDDLRETLRRSSDSARRTSASSNAAFRGEINTTTTRLIKESDRLNAEIKRAINHTDARLRRHVNASVSRLEAKVDTLQWPGEQAEALLRAIKAGYTRLEKEQERERLSVERANRAVLRQFNHVPAEIDALLQVHRRSQLNDPLPLMGGWALSPRGMLQAIDLVTRPDVSLALECGSGTSTLFLARALQLKGSGRLIALEHMEEFLEPTLEALKQHGLEDVVEVRHAPLTEVEIDGGVYLWYDTSSILDLNDLDLLIVDGPPASTGTWARFPAYPLLSERLAHSALILVDDLQRSDERAVVDAWLEMGGVSELPTYGREQAILQIVP
ncbi:MAG TPA: class I SAM-dependent methyltransferase [Acidimicrobiia bacterium]